MRDTDRPRFAMCIAGLAELYRSEISKPLISLYWSALSELTIEQVEDGIGRHVKDPQRGQFRPTPADIIRQARGITDDVALRAWAKFYTGMRKNYGRYVAFDDPLIHAVVCDMGGASAIFGGYEAQIPRLKNEFVDRYVGYLSRGERPGGASALGYFPPYTRCENLEVVLFGDETKALAVFDAGVDTERFHRPLLESSQMLEHIPATQPAARLAAPQPVGVTQEK